MSEGLKACIEDQQKKIQRLKAKNKILKDGMEEIGNGHLQENVSEMIAIEALKKCEEIDNEQAN